MLKSSVWHFCCTSEQCTLAELAEIACFVVLIVMNDAEPSCELMAPLCGIDWVCGLLVILCRLIRA